MRSGSDTGLRRKRSHAPGPNSISARVVASNGLLIATSLPRHQLMNPAVERQDIELALRVFAE
jgi:hypothetical protein